MLIYKHVFTNRVETVLILIRWLRQKPADLDLQCFQQGVIPVSAGQVFKALKLV